MAFSAYQRASLEAVSQSAKLKTNLINQPGSEAISPYFATVFGNAHSKQDLSFCIVSLI